MKKKSYIVAVQATVRPTVYVEVLATSAADAMSQVKEDALGFVKNNLKLFKEETRLEFEDVSETQVKTISCGRASQYHSESECSVCRKASK